MTSKKQVKDPPDKVIKIGLLHSLTGSMAISEKPLLNAEMLAIDQINASGGILGKTIYPVIADGTSDAFEFANKAKELVHSGIDTIFGCWTSASRKAVRPVMEEINGLLWYPVHYEGFEGSKCICYTGSSLNQQIIPAIDWVIKKLGKKAFLIGSDYIFPHTANFLVRNYLEDKGGAILEERYVSTECENFKEVIDHIQQKKPDFIFNTINGISNVSFYKQLHKAGITAKEIPVMATSVTEPEFAEITDIAAGNYSCHSYFQSINSRVNKDFVKQYFNKYPDETPISASMVNAWVQIMLWKLAVEKAKSFEPGLLKPKLKGIKLNSPMGKITIDPNFHVRKPMRIGVLNPDGQFKVIWKSKRPVRPLPWLGLEALKFPSKNLVIKSLSAFSDNINSTIWLQKEIEERIRAEQIASENAEIVKKKVAELNEEIEHRKYIERALNRFTTAVEQAPLSIVITDLEGKIEYVNPKFCETTGFGFKEAVNNNPSILKSGETPEKTYPQLWDTIKSGKIWQGEFINKKKNNEIYFEEAVIAPIKDEHDNIINFIALKTDITARKIAEEKLKNSEIELKELNATKDKLFSVIAHDLKSPFAAIIGLSELLLNRFKDSDDKHTNELLDNMYMVSSSTFKMLENLLSWAKNQTNQINIFLETLDLNNLVSDTLYFSKTIAQKKNIQIEFIQPDHSLKVKTDSNMFGIVLGNLVSNAIKFTKEDGVITVTIDMKGRFAIISVTDNGVGMDNETREALFKSNVHVSTYGTNSEKGTGLGLVVCKEFVNKLGGAIWVESEKGKGSKFSFTLPLHKVIY